MTKDRTYCPSCGEGYINVEEPELFMSKNGTQMVRLRYICYECGYEWDDVLNIAEYGLLKAKGRI